ncbi:c-type cytochrome [Paenibacillus athensensis]|uniref:Cytochrome C n=1 Tax=Paenibacillus athensensis TaxID=1967502 RepID=A0A4Y8PYH2_9BACL|nr:cytochrome ubiquinol oxidase subunit I [Paenibacillus athensensis]MCD1261238.1 c-type cytochrome [Paenibacillus athensensis]
MGFPTIDFGWLGNGNLIGMMAVLHVMINHAVAIGGSILMVSIEFVAVRQGNERLEAFARRLSKWILMITTTVGAMTGVGIWFTTTVIEPYAIGSLLRIFHWAWFTEWLVFVTEVVLILVYYYTWDRWSGSKKKWHLRTGVALCVASWFTLVLITGILAAQINPGNWVETLSFWSAFFNPTWVPSTLFRTFAAITLGVALLTPINRWFVKDERDRHVVLKVYGKWLIASVPLMLLFGVWYQHSLPEKAKTLVVWGSGMNDFTFNFVNMTGLVLMFVLGVLLLEGKSRFSAILTVFTALFSLMLLAEFEIVRENIRKPYVVYNYMYANGVLKSQVDTFRKEGMLVSSPFTSVKEITEENKIQAGEELFRMQCIVCHSIDGVRRSRAMTVRTAGWTEEAIAAFIPHMNEARPVMPPFAGTDAEVKALAAYIHQMTAEQNAD